MQRMGDLGSISLPIVTDIRSCPDTILDIDGTQVHLYTIACTAVTGNISFYTPEFTESIIVDCAMLRIRVNIVCTPKQADSCQRQIRLLNSLLHSPSTPRSSNEWMVDYVVNGERQSIQDMTLSKTHPSSLSVNDTEALRRLTVFIDSVRMGMPRYFMPIPTLWQYESALSGLLNSVAKDIRRDYVGLSLDSICESLKLTGSQRQLLVTLVIQSQMGRYFVSDLGFYELYNRQRNVDSTTLYAKQILPMLKRLQRFSAESNDGRTILKTVETMLNEAGSKADTVHLYFWATWCGNCYAQMEQLRLYADSVRQRGHEVLSFAIQSTKSSYETTKHRLPGVSKFLHHMEDATLHAAFSRAFGLSTVPRLLTVSRDGSYYNPKVVYVR
jgi:thiol-disulfide isomerase/thioredoxin